MRLLYIAQGEEAVSSSDGVVISTVLGSCVSICLWDEDVGVGGMNHLLLPELASDAGALNSVGAIAMERLINRMVREGADRRRLRAKLFGGGSMLSGLTDIGARNARFGRNYLVREAIPCEAESTGGEKARRIKFWPSTGRVRQRFVEEAPALKPAKDPEFHEVELF